MRIMLPRKLWWMEWDLQGWVVCSLFPRELFAAGPFLFCLKIWLRIK